MKIHTKLLFYSLFLITFSSINLFAQNSITGIVFDNNRKPVADITVELLDEFERLIRQTQTGTSGLYQFQSLRSGNYYVQINTGGTGFKEAKERIQLGQGNRTDSTGRTLGSESVQHNFYLQIDPRRSSSVNQTVNEVVFAQEIPPDAEKFYKDALENFKENKRDAGIDLLLKAVSAFPDYFLALERLGNEYLLQNKFEEAENVFKRAVEINKNSYSARYGLGAAQYKLKKFAEAEKTLETAAVSNPSSINAFFLLGKVGRELSEFEKAETNLLKAKKLSNNSLADIHWELALLYYHNLKRYNEAADELELYLKANPKAKNKEQVKKLIKTFRTKAKENKP
jgi:tetratricopeptide (TPR) repeat protein